MSDQTTARQKIANLLWWSIPSHDTAEAKAKAEQMLDDHAAEVRRQHTELATEMLAPQQCPAGLHADWLVDSEYAHACPWCRIADLEGPAVEARAALASLCYDLEDPGSNALGALYLISRATTGVEAPRDEAAQVLASHEAQVMRRCAEFVRDTYDGQWADDAAATLERDADIAERGCPGYEDAGWGDTVAERQLANCKHCGRPRAVCVAAPAPAVAPLAAYQPSEAPTEPETATRPPTPLLDRTEHYLSVLHTHHAQHDTLAAGYRCAGCELRDAIRAQQDPETEPDAIHLHFGLSYCNYLVLPRTFLQSMPDPWQNEFVALLDQLNTAFRHVPQAERYQVEAATEHIVGEMSDAELRQAGITEDWYRGETPPDGLDDEDLREWQAAHEDPEGPVYSRDGEELDRHQRVLIPVADPIPHYDRGRARIEPQPAV